MAKPVPAGPAGALAAALAVMQLALPLPAQAAAERHEQHDPLEHLSSVFERIRAGYVEAVDEAALVRAAIDGMLSSLDPHSAYLPPEEYETVKARIGGAYGGLGVEIVQEDGAVKVVATTEGAPAERAGIRLGDFITHVDGGPVGGLTLGETSGQLRGPVGSQVTLTVLREGETDPYEVEITRENITMRSVRSHLDDGVAVVRISTFNGHTFAMLEEQIAARIDEAGGIDAVAGFVLDLRNNPGGLLDQAVRVSDAFLEAGDIVSTRGNDPKRTARFSARDGDLAQGKPVVVLINGRSASASEIVAGALQDHGRAVVVGTRSFGKGSVQTIMPIERSGAMRLTTARYYTPSGRSIQALGIAPDVIVDQPPASGAASAAAAPAAEPAADAAPARRGALRDREAEAVQRRSQDYQMAYALDILRGLAFFGEVQR